MAVQGSERSSLARAGDDSSGRRCLTTTSFMVTGRAAQGAAALSREHPDLSVGLHWDVKGEDEREFLIEDERAVRDDFARQLECFRELIGRDPTHVDSHKDVHRDRQESPLALFCELVEPLGVPLRGRRQRSVRWWLLRPVAVAPFGSAIGERLGFGAG
jgi:predicted glycoside hydrolase/deacetylase ChbG (UPF0249 family)